MFEASIVLSEVQTTTETPRLSGTRQTDRRVEITRMEKLIYRQNFKQEDKC